MSAEEAARDAAPAEEVQPPSEPAAMAAENKKRPRLDLDVLSGSRERKRGKSMFGLLVGTLNKAKIEDKERNASEAAKKRQLIEQRLQNKLKKETDSVRRAEEAKKDKTSANRKEEDLQLKDSIISTDGSTPTPPNPLSNPPRSHPPPLYYLPAVLLPSQEAFLARRKAEVAEAAEKEWQLFHDERETGIKDVNQLRQRVADEELRRKSENANNAAERDNDNEAMDTDAPPASATEVPEDTVPESASMDVDVEKAEVKEVVAAPEREKKEEPVPLQADDDDAVEY
ncbi:hypothetical protein H0H92_006086 [Tricholoma furcatifolium]|nr:hypothetical protein H0H92_006086 [Tricholoma furcatifolium]